jgi:prevent-host-death family protein
MTMVMKRISASQFKARCLALLDGVADSGESLEVTKRGRPVARVVPVEKPPALEGSVEFRVDDDELLAPIEAGWDAQGP